MKITLPLPPNLANSRMHWRVKQKEKKAYWEKCEIQMGVEGRLVRTPPHFHTKITATIYCGGRMDHDNAIARLKWPVDFMVGNGWLAGDSPKHLSWSWPIEQVVSRNHIYCVEFELEAA